MTNVENEAEEVMWGTPGTMLAARMLLAETGEERWAAAWRASADALPRGVTAKACERSSCTARQGGA